ncbi:MAG: ACP S-malonyltransferase [Oscillospiraceae bacterium]|jgi:[acyl-carrier-protein] S-malonyltransferase|nr:ACP S-malonyltransferase [Oscillospiraceae bacterium]
MKLAFLYAGQGSQKEYMGKDFYESYPEIRPRFDSPRAGFDIKEICFSPGEERLSNTMYTQACMAAFAAAVTDLLAASGIVPDYAAGLSLGEYSALYCSGVFDADTLIELLAYRGKVMAETTADVPCAMYAVLGLSEELVTRAADEAARATGKVAACANFNCPGQIVIGGETSAVETAAALCKEYGSRRIMPLNVSGPFHTPLMEEASGLLWERFKTVKFSEMKIPVVFNCTADLSDDADIPDLLRRQVKSPVLFEKSVRRLEALGVDTVVEIGPGKVISGFVKKTAPEITVYSIEDIDSFKNTALILGCVR